MTLDMLKERIQREYGSESALARHLGWPRQKINRITRVHCKPNIIHASQLADALHVPVEEIIEIFLPDGSPNGV